jgi:uncharacterized repeat protein (TIGR03803 family)
MAFFAAPLHAQQFQDLYDFNCSTGGCIPFDQGSLTQWKDNNLYGTTPSGGTSNVGTIFMITPTPPATYTDLYNFDSKTAARPDGGLTLASDGNFYGTTYDGGTSDLGTVFRFNPSSKPTAINVLHNFKGSDGQNPEVPPVQAKDGNLYGITLDGHPYRVTLPAGTFTPLPSLAPGNIYDPLFLASDGNLYGVSPTGGSSSLGTIFRMSTAGTFTVVHNFTGAPTDGAVPRSTLSQASSGILYGTTEAGGNSNLGTVFEMSLPGTVKTLFSFTSSDGNTPEVGMLVGPDGFLYGVSEVGGSDSLGSLFLLTKGGVYNDLFDFTGTSGAVPGKDPGSTLVAHTNGTFYGTTAYGGTSGGDFADGNIYSLTPPNPIPILITEGPIFVHPGVPVQILGNNLEQVTNVSFGGVQAQFQRGSDNYLTAQVPSAAIDGRVSVTLPSGQQIESQQSMHILPKITNLDPSSGPVGTEVGIVGGGFLGATRVTFGGVKATSFRVVSPTLIRAIVPTGAKTGKVSVTTRNGTAFSKETFSVN